MNNKQYCSKGHENPSGTRFCQYCGEKLTPDTNGIYPGAILGDRYRIERELGHGGFGRTYLAFDLNRFNEPCVLKEFAPQVQTTQALEKASELFEREAGVLYKLQHPQIPRFRELFRFNQQGKDSLFLVQDYVEGQTYYALLNARIAQGLRFNEVEVTQLLLQILPVLEYIHSLGVIHRDISPDNMMLRSTDGLPVLIDFGGVKQVAATIESQFIQPGGIVQTLPMPTRLGKVGYAPDEQMFRGIVAPHSDLYALAVTMLVLLTGKEPNSLRDPQTLSWNWQREVSLSPNLGAVLDKMLAPWTGDRYQSAREVLQALANNPQPLPPIYPPTQSPPEPATEATRAIAPPNPDPVTPIPVASQSSGASGTLGKTLLVTALIAGAAGIGWWGANLWLNSQSQTTTKPIETTPSPSTPPSPVETVKPSPQISDREQQRQASLRQRRTSLGIDEKYYNDLVNDAFWTQNPNQRGRTLGNGSEDEQLREQRDTVAAQLLDKIEEANLSQDARGNLGKYEKADRDRWKVAANQLHVGSRTLYDLADAKFFRLFPQQSRGENFLNKPIGQIWHAIAADKLKAIQSGSVLETLRFDPGATDKQVSGNLKPGEGKVYIAQLSANQLMELKLKAAKDSLLSSIYSPSGNAPLLEDSRERSWSGKLPESGYYEIVLISNARESIDYQLDLTVNNPTTPASPQPSNSSTPVPSPSESSTSSPQSSPTEERSQKFSVY